MVFYCSVPSAGGMIQKMMLSLFVFTVSLFNSLDAFANARSVYFTQTARNTTSVGLQSAARARCRIQISNPSSTNQEYSYTITATATGTAAGTASGSAASASWTPITPGAVVTLEYQYPSYSPTPTITSGSQVIVCAGTINVRNASAGSPGFIIASGILTVFTEAAQLQTTVSSGQITYGGQAVYSQIPIVINSQRPF